MTEHRKRSASSDVISAPRPCPSSRKGSPVGSELTYSGRFSSFEIALALRDTSWGEVVTSGDYKTRVLIRFLWGARQAGSNFEETGVSTFDHPAVCLCAGCTSY
jgi:hypothetical protein